MGKYDKFKKLILPLNVVKTTITMSLPGLSGQGQKTMAGPGNEGIDLAEWFQERIDDNTINITSPDVDDLVTLTGLPIGSIDLGTFTGSIITDNTSIVNALQELETYIEGLVISGGNGIYGGSGNIPNNTVATALGSFYISSVGAGKRIMLGNDSSGYHATIFNDSAIIIGFGSASNGFYVENSYTKLSHNSDDYIRLSGDANSELKSSHTSFKINAQTPGTFQGLVYAFDPSANFVANSLVTKFYVDNLLSTPLTIGSGLTGDGSIGNPLDWAGAFTSGPITGSGTTFFPLTLANNSITSNYIQNGSILFQDLNQNGAISGQVPQWTGSAWVASSITGTLPAGNLGDTLLHNGTAFAPVSEITETITGVTGTSITLASTPIAYGRIMLFRNGQYLIVTDDYTRSGTSITILGQALVSTDKITAIYYI